MKTFEKSFEKFEQCGSFFQTLFPILLLFFFWQDFVELHLSSRD